ncbi:transmembrane protein 51a [Hemibagrus wyckioides]|nr:transmembrane protein 51a [Hemibagrus wyckioides]XP_058246348.1 transmembrane protein 51a [Hemibagrus wyckioides]XP_058246349.1 transmembrane protein 51a [Hemibagrus wyckioides]
MSYSSQTPPDSNNNGSGSSSASQYATAALGVGLLVLGIVMILWSVVPVGNGLNKPQNGPGEVRNTSSVGFVLLGTGVSMLLLSLFLGIQNKYRAMRQPNSSANTEQGQQVERQPDQSEQYTVPSYEEVVGNPEYPISQFSPRQNSTTQLPAYDELVETTQDEVEGPRPPAHKNGADNLNSSHMLPHRTDRSGLKLLPLKTRRKSSSSSPQVTVCSIEPLTPPPQYEENPPELLPATQ